jgi:hypothetical protein
VNGQLNNLVFSKSEILFFSPAQSADRGRFAAAQTIAGRSTLLVDALLGNLAIAMASALGRGAEVMRRSFRLASESVSLLFIVLAPITLAAVALLTGPVLGHGYQGLAGAATALAAMSLLQSGAAPLLALRFAQKTIGPLIAAGAAGALVDLGIAALLVRHHGVVGAVIANVAGSAIYLGVTVALFTRQTGVRDLAIVHAVKLTALVAYASVLPVLLMALPRTVGLWLGLPLALAWTVIALRLPGLRVSDRVISELATDVLPRRVGRLLLVPWVRRLLAGR